MHKNTVVSEQLHGNFNPCKTALYIRLSREDGDKAQETLAKHRYEDGCGECHKCQRPVRRCHLHTRARKRESDKHDHGAHNNGREEARDEAHAAHAHQEAHNAVDCAHSHKSR